MPKKKVTLPVYFATNRALVPKPGGPTEFSDGFNHAPNPLHCGKATCTVNQHRDDFRLSDCVIGDNYSPHTFKAAIRQEIVKSPGNLFIYVHGFCYHFYEAALRTAWISQWYAGAKPKFPNTVVLFSWPSLGSFSPDAYEIDVQNVRASAIAFDLFMDVLVPLIEDYRKNNPQGRVVLMGHSLGAFMLSVGLPLAIGPGPGQYNPAGKPRLFDAVILPAADADSDALKHAGKLLCLKDIAARIGVHYNNMDYPLLTFAPAVHNTARLGVDGPPNKLAFADMPAYEFVNCSTASPKDDTTGEYLDWQHHQYYRLVEEVRDDICHVALGTAPPRPNRKYRAAKNYYSLYLE